LISIIIPYYNRPIKLERALKSIENQTYKDFEIIVVDDNSQKTPLNSTLKKVAYIKNQINRGPGYSRNVGLKIAKGDYVCFLDSDDYLHPLFFEKCLNKIQNCKSEISFVYSNTMLVSNEKEIDLWKKKITETKIIPSILCSGRSWSTSACLWNSEILRKHSGFIETRNWEDYAFDIEAATICNNIQYIEDPLLYYETQGEEKLSEQSDDIVSVERAKSVIKISETLVKSDFYSNKLVRIRMQIIIINALIGLAKLNLIKSKNYNLLIIQLKKWSSFYYVFIIKFTNLMNNKVSLKLLRLIRKKIVKTCVDF
jgi:glycosyltransferase involved in cell wall biosynthesis